MDTKFQTSFIPKKAMAPGSVDRPKSVSIALLISIIIFVITLAAAGAVFGYKRVLVQRIDTMNKKLAEAKNSFEPEFVEKLNRLNKRIESAKRIIDAHTAVSPILDMLENDTLATVKFDTFSYEMKDTGQSSVVMSGQAKTYSSIALQSDIFGRNEYPERYIKNPVFSDLNPDQSGNIIFKFNASLDGALVSYKNAVAASTVGQ